MQQKRWKKIETILDTALTLSGSERTTYISDACRGDDDLIDEVYQMLRAIEESEQTNFLEKVSDDNRQFIQNVSQIDVEADIIGTRIGAFQITEKIGSGGMGAVYKADRVDGQFSQQVAIKMLQRGIRTENTIRRFRMEQEILASLKHPNIAQMFDGGITKEGTPYLVMEYVDGLPIDKFCNKHKKTIEERIDLFREVCLAVQFAHANLIIHRDLKTQNIYVTDDGRVKVLDFGIAKLLDPNLSEQTLLVTGPGQKFWTPQYAAPEQVSGENVTISVDVYALGVLLHKLLTDSYPLDLKDKSLSEIQKVITGTPPQPPSNSIQNPVTVAETRQITPALLRKKLSGDLDALVLKSVRKEPEYRYDSVSQLIEDLDRFKKGLPILARKDTIRYRIGKFYRRNRTGISLAVVILITFLLASAYYTFRITQERDLAEYEAERAKQVSDFVVNLFYGNHPDIAAGRELSAADLLEMGLESADTLSQPEIKADILDAIGRAYVGMGNFDTATPILEEAYEISSEFHGTSNEKPGIIMMTLGDLYRRKGDYNKAMSFSQNALDHFQNIPGDHKYYISRAYNSLADIHFFLGDHDEAVRFHQSAYDIQSEIFDSTDPNLAATLNAMNASLFQQGKFHEAKKNVDRIIAIFNHNFGDKHPRTVEQYSNQALISFELGDYEMAEEQSRRTLTLKKEIYKSPHPSLAAEYNNLGKIIIERNKFEEADSLLRIAVKMREQIYGPTHIYLARSIHNLAKALAKKGLSTEATEHFEKSLEMIRQSVPPSHPMITRQIAEFGNFLIQNEQYDDALSLLLNRRQEIENKGLHERDGGILEQTIGINYLRTQNYSEAEKYLLSSFEILEEKGLDSKNDRAKNIDLLIQLYKEMGLNEKMNEYQQLRSTLI